jgi:S1-C subfamily serine protease
MVTVIPSNTEVAPQVVTVVHRVSGVKLLRLFLRQAAGQSGVVETIDPEAMMGDAHASVIAGWALDDGKTIAARLPQAAAELEPTRFMFDFPATKAEAAAAAAAFRGIRPRVEPDVTVITRDGQKFRARLVGLDAETGLSILQLAAAIPPPPAPRTGANEKVKAGEGIAIFAPEETTPEGETAPRITYVKVGKVDATVKNGPTDSSATPERLLVEAAKLSPVVVGGVACDKAGNTIGIVESIEGTEAHILTAETIRLATQRVLNHKASVPRPVLGVRGEPVEPAARAALLAHGWNDQQTKDLISAQVGILLTAVVPQTPAAQAKLQPGDIILQVNQIEIKNAEEFSKLLGQAGSGEQVKFLVKRPDAADTWSVPVTLGSSYAPQFEWRAMPAPPLPFNGLQTWGIQSMTLGPRTASQFGMQSGLVVVMVQPQSMAAKAGILEGDILESIDGRTLGRGVWTFNPQFWQQKKHTVALVRGKEKKQVVLEAVE